MKKKIALIFGVTGQDGAYLAKFLLKKNYVVHGVKRRNSTINTYRIDDIYEDPFAKKQNFILHYGDITDSLNIFKIINNLKNLSNVSMNIIYEGSFKKKLVKANKIKSSACIILGEDEYKEDKVIWKDFISGQQELVDLNDLDNFIFKKTK